MAEYKVPLAELLPALVDDLSTGSTNAAEMIRDIIDHQINQGAVVEAISDVALDQLPIIWATLTASTSAEVGKVEFDAES